MLLDGHPGPSRAVALGRPPAVPRPRAGPGAESQGTLLAGTVKAGRHGGRASAGRGAGVPAPRGLRFHDLRHTGVSSLIAAGVPVPEVAAIAGHATPAVTNQLYAHAVRRARGTALGEAAAFHQAQLDALHAPDAAAAAPAQVEADEAAERADSTARPGQEGP